MLTRRIIPCLDVREGKVVKGVRFRDHVIMGDIVELALRYRDAGADELVFYDITASPEQRRVDRGWVERVARVIDIPFCVAGGIRSVADARELLHAGADKISVNSPALECPALINELASEFGSQCVVVGIDSLRDEDGEWRLRQYSGDPTQMRALARRTLDWVREVQQRGAGEIVLNCMDADGVREGFDLEQLTAVREVCKVPLVASGGAGNVAHFAEVFQRADVDGALAASVFHNGSISIAALKQHLTDTGIQVRPCSQSACSQAVAAKGAECELANAELDWDKGQGLLPAIVQHWRSGEVLMLGYMNAESLARTRSTDLVTFYSRSRQGLWTKGETSGNTLACKSIHVDCDADALLILAEPKGPTCHRGTSSCFADTAAPSLAFLGELDELVAQREQQRPAASYTTKLFDQGIRRIAQKVGEEGVETALAAVAQDDDALLDESADLIYHLLILLRARGLGLADVSARLQQRSVK